MFVLKFSTPSQFTCLLKRNKHPKGVAVATNTFVIHWSRTMRNVSLLYDCVFGIY